MSDRPNSGMGDRFHRNTQLGQVVNLELASSAIEVQGDFVFLKVREFQQGVDLNGDGDIGGRSSDLVLHVYDAVLGQTHNLGLAVAPSVYASGLRFLEGGSRVAFRVIEADQRSDLNADGDRNDEVVHILDYSSWSVINTGLAGEEMGFLSYGGVTLLALAVSEAAHGSTDLNGDGDAMDVVFHLFDLATQTATNLRLAINDSLFSRRQVFDGAIVFLVDESKQGNTDLNGDSDAQDVVAHVYDLVSETTSNLRLASHARNACLPLEVVDWPSECRRRKLAWISTAMEISRT